MFLDTGTYPLSTEPNPYWEYDYCSRLPTRNSRLFWEDVLAQPLAHYIQQTTLLIGRERECAQADASQGHSRHLCSQRMRHWQVLRTSGVPCGILSTGGTVSI